MGIKRKSMVCLSEEGAIIKEPSSQGKEELVWWERRGRGKREYIWTHTKAEHMMDSKENTLESVHLGPLMPC